MNNRRFFRLILPLFLLSACATKPKSDSSFPLEYSTPTSPCFQAVIKNSLEAVKKVTDICLKSRNANGTSPLMLASAKGYADIVDYLLQSGFDVNEADITGDTALNYAVTMQHVDVVQLLILNRASLNTQKPDGLTTLMQAIQNGSARMVQVLAQHPDGVNQKAGDGWTALYFAVRRKDPWILKYLLQRGACPNTIDSYQQSPLDFAKEVKWDKGIEMLSKAKPCGSAI